MRLNSLAEHACAVTDAQGAAIALKGAEGMVCCANSGRAPALGARLQTNSGLSGECVRLGEVVSCRDTENDPRINRSVSTSLGLRSLCIVPVHSAGEVIGLLEVFSDQPDHFSDAHVLALQDMAREVAQIADDSVARTSASIQEEDSPIESETRPNLPPQTEIVQLADDSIPRTSGWIQEDDSPIESETTLNLPPQTDVPDRGVSFTDEAPNGISVRSPSDFRYAAAPEVVTSEIVPDVSPDSVQTRIPSRSLSAGWDARQPIPMAKRTLRPKRLRAKSEKQILIAGLAVLTVATLLSGWWLYRRNPQAGVSGSVQASSQGLTPSSATQPLLPDSPPKSVNQHTPPKPTVTKREIQKTIGTATATRETIQMPAPSRDSAEIAAPPMIPPTEQPLKASIPIVLSPSLAPQLVPEQSKVSGGDLLFKVQPDYPIAAKLLNREATLLLKAIVAKDGSVRDVRVVSGDAIFGDAAMKAVKKWRYRPYYLNGQPMEAETLITIKFSGAR